MVIIFVFGRILFGGYFFISGLKHFTDIKRLSGYAASKGVPLAPAAVAASGALIVVGGWLIVLGIYITIAVSAIVIFLLPVSVVMHNFWAESGEQSRVDKINFQKNMALIGAVLMILFIAMPWPLSL